MSYFGAAYGSVRYDRDRVPYVGYPVGAKAYMTCNSGYTHTGATFWTCLSTGSWSREAFTCRSNNEKIFLILISKVVCANSNNFFVISPLSLVNGLHSLTDWSFS